MLAQKGASNVVKNFEAVVTNLESAKAVNQFSHLAKKELVEVDNLEYGIHWLTGWQAGSDVRDTGRYMRTKLGRVRDVGELFGPVLEQ